MNKINLIETITRESHVRKTVDPGLIIGNEETGYIPGDILDAKQQNPWIKIGDTTGDVFPIVLE